MNDLPVIALRTDSSTKARHWQSLLAGMNCKVILEGGILGGEILDSGLAASGASIDIVITDSLCQLEDSLSWQKPAEIHGVIGVGAEFAADVMLSAEPTECELRLACSLLFEIVLLRREREASQQTQQLLTEMAELDGLTGLANRRAWDAELAERMKRVDAGEKTLCLAVFDLDHFKEVNTTHGYPVADQVLQQAGSALRVSLRSGDFVARIGGDEFGVLLANISAEHAATVVERIRASIAASLERTGLIVVTATAGLAMRQPSHDVASLFAAADANLRQGKSAGRNQTIASK